MGLDNTSMRVSFVRRTLPDDALQSDTPLPRRALRARAGAHQHPGAPLVSPASLQHLGLLGTASVWAAHRFNDRQVWSCSSCCRRNLSAAYSHYQQPCVKEPSVDNLREAMHGDAARTAALLLMIACSTDAPATPQRLFAVQVSAPGGGRSALAM